MSWTGSEGSSRSSSSATGPRSSVTHRGGQPGSLASHMQRVTRHTRHCVDSDRSVFCAPAGWNPARGRAQQTRANHGDPSAKRQLSWGSALGPRKPHPPGHRCASTGRLDSYNAVDDPLLRVALLGPLAPSPGASATSTRGVAPPAGSPWYGRERQPERRKNVIRDPDRIDAMLTDLAALWRRDPDMRLGQLVVNLVRPKAPRPEVFYFEDTKLHKRIRKALVGAPFE